MSKRFITLKDVEEQISNGKIYLDEKAILSSSLQDYIREHNIQAKITQVIKIVREVLK